MKKVGLKPRTKSKVVQKKTATNVSKTKRKVAKRSLTPIKKREALEKGTLTLFFDLGRVGGFALFDSDAPILTEQFSLSKADRCPPEKKITLFRDWLHKRFPEPESFSRIATFVPSGNSRWTIVHLSIMVGVLASYFHKIEIELIDEWEAWRKICGKIKIPKRKKKKAETKKWAESYIKKNNITEDEADSLMGGVFLLCGIA